MQQFGERELPLEELESRLRTTEGEDRIRFLHEYAKRIRKSEPARAIELSREELTSARELGSTESEAVALLGLGMCHLEGGDCESALRSQLAGLRLAEGLDNRLLLGRAHSDLGLTHHVWRNYDRALEYHQSALELFEEFSDLDGQALSHNGIGLVHVKRKELEPAIDHFQIALELARKRNDRLAILGALNNVGNILNNQGRYEEAIQHFRESIELKEQLGDRKGLAGSLINIGMAQAELGDLEDARANVEAGLALAEETGAGEFSVAGLDCLSAICQRMGDLESALDACRRLVVLTRDSFDEQQSRRIAEMQARYDTERAAREAELNRLRTQELSKQLERAQRMGVVGRLAGGVAHDFNNLLTAIGGYAELMLYNLGESHPLRRNVDEIRRATERAQSLTRQLLAFSRKQILQPQVLDLSRVILELRPMLGRLLGEDVELRIHLEPELHPVFADAGQLEQVIVNLAINARDSMATGGMLSLDAGNVEHDGLPSDLRPGLSPGSYVRLSVTDDGCGMDPETMEQIFEPFFTTKGRDKGTGLGLATVDGILSQSGGGISVESEPGGGSVFSVFLPRTDRVEAKAGSIVDRIETSGGEETVLVVEDDQAVLNLAAEILRMHGYAVIVAGSADEARKRALSHIGPIDLLLTDVILPDLRGDELARRIQSTRSEIRVLFISGHPFDALSRDGTIAPDTELVEKPFGANRLVQRVREVLDRKRKTPQPTDEK